MRVVHPCLLFFLLCCFALGGMPLAGAAPASSSENVTTTGALPSGGKAVMRSGMQWMDERAPLFLRVRAALAPLLEVRGFALVSVAPSALQPVPHFPAPEPAARGGGRKQSVPSSQAFGSSATTEEAARAAAAELSASGRLPQVSLRRYDVAGKDADLPAAVLAIAPPDPQTILFALSQQRGTPLMKRAGSIPGHLPGELAAMDARAVDVAFVVRLALVQPQPSRGAAYGGSAGFASGGGLSGVSGSLGGSSLPGGSSVGGVATLGAQAPQAQAPRLAPGQGTAQDFARGYEGMSPRQGRPHVAADMRARDYAERLAPPPPLATPPQAPALRREDSGRGSLGSTAAMAVSGAAFPAEDAGAPAEGSLEGGVPAHTGYRLELYCYDLAPARTGGAPRLLWQSVVQKRAEDGDVFDAFAHMARLAVEGTKRK